MYLIVRFMGLLNVCIYWCFTDKFFSLNIHKSKYNINVATSNFCLHHSCSLVSILRDVFSSDWFCWYYKWGSEWILGKEIKRNKSVWQIFIHENIWWIDFHQIIKAIVWVSLQYR